MRKTRMHYTSIIFDVYRDGCRKTIDQLHEHSVPLLIFSAGLGNIIQEVIEQQASIYDTVKIVSNMMKFDEQVSYSNAIKSKILPINLSKPARKIMLSDWWLARVTLVAAFRFLGGGGDLLMIVLLLNECSLRSVDNQTWWGLLNPTCFFTTNLNFLHSQVAGTQKLRPQAFTPTPTPSEPSGGISTI